MTLQRSDIHFPPKHEPLRDDVHALGALVGEILREQGGEQLFELVELDRVAAMLSVLDVTVCAPTAVSWLAAGTGVPTLKALYDTSWTSFGELYEPFAPAARCLMPARRGDWADVFAQASETISSLRA